MKRAPSGFLALAFATIEPLEAAQESHPSAAAAAHALLAELLRRTVLLRRGQLLEGQRGSALAAFEDPLDAVHWAFWAQEALLQAAWPAQLLTGPLLAPEHGPDGELLFRGPRLKVGLHLGAPSRRVETGSGKLRLFGPVVSRLVRIAGAAHGGQILASAPLWAALADRQAELPALLVEPLGELRLRGADGPEPLLQLLPRSLAGRRFAPPTPAGQRRGNLPARLPLVGRAQELRELRTALASGARLLTLTGQAGVGKSLLALHAAASFSAALAPGAGGAWHVSLQRAWDLDGFTAAVGATIGAALWAGRGADDTLERLGRALADRGLLLLFLDGFDPLLPLAAQTVGRLLAAAPELRLLVSARGPLGLQLEQCLELAPLRGATAGEAAAAAPAAQLVAARVARAQPGLELGPGALALLSGLSGIPLALELAAAQAAHHGAAGLLALKAHGEAGARDGGLEAALSWAFGLLAPWERAALCQATAFHGSFSLEAAEAVLELSDHPGAPPIAELLDTLEGKALLTPHRAEEAPGELRYFLPQAVEDFAVERLDAGEAAAAVSRHTSYFLDLARALLPGADRGRVEELCLLELDRANLLAVHERAIEHGPPVAVVDTAFALSPLLMLRGPFEQLLPLLAAGVAAARRPGVPAQLLSRALSARGNALRSRGRLDEALVDLEEGLALARGSDEQRTQARILEGLGVLLQQRGDGERARARYDEALALAVELHDGLVEGRIRLSLASLAQDRGAPEEAERELLQALPLLRAASSRRFEAIALTNLGVVHAAQGRRKDARAELLSALELHRLLGNRRWEGTTLVNLGELYLREDRPTDAAAALEQALLPLREVSDRRVELYALGCLAAALALDGEAIAAEARLVAAESRASELTDPSVRDALGLHRGIVEASQAAAAQRSGDRQRASALRARARGRLALADPPPPDDGSVAPPLAEVVELAAGLLRLALAAAQGP